LWVSVRDELSERRQQRAEHRVLRAELASYRTPAEVEDLLSSLRGAQGSEAAEVRDILHRNLMQVSRLAS
jgi:hypothetical protein